MELITLAELEQKLKVLADNAPSFIDKDELQFRLANMVMDDIILLEVSLQIELPTDFKNLIMKYEFGRLAIGDVSFGPNDKYIDCLLEQNQALSVQDRWSGDVGRSSKHIWIADTDGYVICLDTFTGHILANLRSEHWSTAQTIAQNFDFFIRASGAVFFDTKSMPHEHKNDYADSISRLVGNMDCSDFWIDLVFGY